MNTKLYSLAIWVLVAACTSPERSAAQAGSRTEERSSSHSSRTLAAPPPGPGQAVAIFAGGCFWCMEPAFEELPGVISVLSGFTGGDTAGPTYEEVSSGRTGHAEAVRVLYDPNRISYEQLLEVFWHNIDPTDRGGQFCDRGRQYRSGIYPASAAQRSAAEASRARTDGLIPGEIVTEIRDATPFWIAEDYHQDFYRTNPARYTQYRRGCGRDARLRELWGEAAGAH